MKASLQETRKTLENEIMNRYAKEDPDWAGAAICDLKHCRTAHHFRIWAEEYGIGNIEQFLKGV